MNTIFATATHEIGEVSLKQVVFIVCDGLNLGGAERQTLLLSRKLPCPWYPVLFSFSDGPMAEEYHASGIPVHFLSRLFHYDFVTPVLKLLYYSYVYTPVVLHSWGWMSAIASAIVVKGRNIAHVSSTIRMGMLPDNVTPLHRFACKLGDVSVANSLAGLNSWCPPTEKGRVVYNGFDWDRITSCLSDTPSPDQAFRAIMIATMSEKKDWRAFIESARFVCNHDRQADVSFYGFGDGPCRKQVLKMAEETSCPGLKLHLPGGIVDPIGQCMQADVGLLLSPYGEGISNSIMEYMACGLPVICTNSGGNPELVVDGVTGFLVDPDNPPEHIAQLVLWLKDNPEKAKQMGQAGRKRIKEDFSTNKMIDSYLRIYRETQTNHRQACFLS